MNQSARDEGVIKYQAIHQTGDAPTHDLLDTLNQARTDLFDLGLVGVYPDGIGFGNVSIRHQQGCIISGTGTGSIRTLSSDSYCYVQNYNLEKNTVYTLGPVNASSESMTHCAIYHADASIQSVLHIHHRALWHRLLQIGYPSTPADIAYGTPQMALSMADLVRAKHYPSAIIVMAGHEDGIISYGQSIPLALKQIYAAMTNSII